MISAVAWVLTWASPGFGAPNMSMPTLQRRLTFSRLAAAKGWTGSDAGFDAMPQFALTRSEVMFTTAVGIFRLRNLTWPNELTESALDGQTHVLSKAGGSSWTYPGKG